MLLGAVRYEQFRGVFYSLFNFPLYFFPSTVTSTVMLSSTAGAPEMQKTIRDIIRKSENIELGGCYSGDHMCLSVSDDAVLIIEYGIWD
jgi:hypothetical protein